MPSNPYSGLPKVCLLCSTRDGDHPIDLLNATGICITNPPGWIPAISQIKGGGVRISSESLDDDTIVAGGYEPVSETFPITINAVDTANRVQTLLNRLWLAEQFWFEGWQNGAVYLKVQLTEDSDLRYSRVKTGAYQIGTYAFGGRIGLPDNTLVLEREPAWLPVPPGEMIGPFVNMAKNPSFERWGYYGIENQVPSGWDEQIDANAPAIHELRREESQIAGPDYALDMSFTGAGGAAPNEWYIHQRVRLVPRQNYTLRIWLNLIMGGGAGETFFIRVTDRTGVTVYLNETYTTSQSGWYHLFFTTDREWLYYILEIGFTAPATASGSRAVIDRIFLTEGAWLLNDWPGNFYMTSTILWPFFEPECHDFASGRGYAVDILNTLDVEDVPGDFEALARFSIDMVQAEVGSSGWTSTAQKIAIFAEKKSQSNQIHLLAPGSVGGQYVIGDSATSYAVPNGATRLIFSHQYNGDEVTQFLDHTFRIFLRAAADYAVSFYASYWVGNPLNEIVLSGKTEIAAAPVAQVYNLVLATPIESIDWGKNATEKYPASIGFSIYVENNSGYAATVKLNYAFLIPSDNGGCYSESIWHQGQSQILDSTSLSRPVQRGYSQTKVTFDNVRGYVAGWTNEPYCARVYNGKLYVFYDTSLAPGTPSGRSYDGTTWSSAPLPVTPNNNTPLDTEIFNGMLWVCTLNGDVHYYDSNAGGNFVFLRTIPGPVDAFSIKHFGSELYVAGADGWVYTMYAAAVQVRNCAPNVPKYLVCYKHQLWAGCTNGTTHYLDVGGWHNGPTLPCADDIVWMIEYKDRLYIACIDGDVYYWDGQALTLSRSGTPLVDDAAHQLEVFNGKLYLLTGGSTVNDVALFETSDGLTWIETYGLSAIQTLYDEMCMEVYNGRLMVAAEKTASSQWGILWHAPLVSMLDIPNHTGTAITLVPQERTRFHVLLEAEGIYFYYINQNDGFGAVPGKIWILPRWRALRGD